MPDATEEKKLLTEPIGVAMSGGGYRAAAFHLGTLSYLHDLRDADLLPPVAMISTVSGGTFTGVRYALALAKSEPFPAFFTSFYTYLQGSNLFRKAMDRLSRGDLGPGEKRRDIIVALAEVYSTDFLADEHGQPYQFEKIQTAQTALRAAIFNATEFRQGGAFRFQSAPGTQARIGNRYVNIPKDEAGHIRLGDIVAASSCFPGGFEPIAFPDDFGWPEGKIPPAVRQRFPKPVALMDGGIYDNQGIESLLYADDRDPADLGLFIISDVDRQPEDIYPMPPDVQLGKLGDTPLGRLHRLAWVWMLACLITACVVGVQLATAEHFTVWNYFSHVVPLILALATAGLLIAGLWVSRRIGERMRTSVKLEWRDFRKITLGQAVTMLYLRGTSLLAMAQAVFMHRIRQLVYGLVYKDDRYKDKRVSCLVYGLQKPAKELAGLVPPPSEKLGRVVKAAVEMPTTLWFCDPHELPCLVACGQATLCYNLMKWVVRQYGGDPAALADPPVGPLLERLKTDWQALNADPYALLRRQMPDATLAEP
ncbi:MAG: patatin-like phospholipase family protein [Phycisphaerae bacterium]|jgi:predicted acylesterase/phospholipase RssA